MKCIILNSGMGTRLEELTENNPKSLVKLHNNETILSRAISIISIDVNFPDFNFTYVHNPFYNKTNYIKSIDLIPDMDDDIILLHGDLVFNQKTAEKVINSNKSCVVIDSTINIPKDDFKAKIEDDTVKYIGVDYFENDAVACQPFYKLKNNDWKTWKNKIRDFCENGKTNVYAENALNELTNDINIYALDLEGLLCMEVDNKNDLKKVKEILK